MAGRSLELRLSQLADGTLPPAEQAVAQADMETNARARQTFIEYRRLQSRLDRALTTPDIQWEALAKQLSSAVEAVEFQAEPPAVLGRIARSVPVWRRRLAVAAGLLVAASAGLLAVHGRGTIHPVVRAAVTPPSSVVVGPQIELARGTASVQITIGPSPVVALQGGDWRYAEGVVTAPAKILFFSKITPPAADDPHLH